MQFESEPSIDRLSAKALGRIQFEAAERSASLSDEVAVKSRDCVNERTRQPESLLQQPKSRWCVHEPFRRGLGDAAGMNAPRLSAVAYAFRMHTPLRQAMSTNCCHCLGDCCRCCRNGWCCRSGTRSSPAINGDSPVPKQARGQA